MLRTMHRARNHRFRFALEIWFLVLLSSSPALGQPVKRPMTVEDQFRLSQPGEPILSPDGRWVLYTIERAVLAENARHSSIWLAPSDGSQPPREFLQEGDASPMWAPSSRSVFFLRRVTAGERQSRELFEQRIEETVAVQRSHLGPGPDATWQLSRDGKFFLVVRPEASASGPGAESDVVFVDEGSNGQTRDFWANLWRYDLGAETLTRITTRDWSINSADLSPDGRSAIVAARPDNGRNTRARTELFVVDLATGSVRQLTQNGVPESNPRWSPDGRYIVFFAVRLDRWEHGNGDLWRVDVASGETRNLTPRHSGRFTQAVFSPDGEFLLASSGYGTTRFPVRIDVASGRITPLIETEGAVHVGSWSDDRRTFAYVYQDFVTPPDIYIGKTGVSADRQHRVTDLNPWVREEIALGSVQRVEWSSFDGTRIEGLLHLPPGDMDVKKPLPMIVHVACGPGCAWLNQFSAKNHVYAGLGYAQLSPNVRGTSNYDDDFIRGNKFDIGGGDRRDLLAGVDAMVARKIADPDRLAIDGWSYGAILAGYTLTKTTRFKAASLGAMVSDWISEYGAGASYDMELWFLGGNPWTKPNHWRERSNLTHADRVRTPTLLHHGDEDDTDSPFHSMNYFAALRKFGTPARLLRYPGEPHDLQQPRHLWIRDTEDIAWMQRFVPGRGGD